MGGCGNFKYIGKMRNNNLFTCKHRVLSLRMLLQTELESLRPFLEGVKVETV